jgi:signal transduction histidine kinase
MNEKDLPGGRAMRRLVRSRSELQRQVTELVEQQAAISEVLRAVANSPHDLQPIFDTILINATRTCGSAHGGLGLFEEKGFRIVARRGPPNPVYAERWPLGLVRPIRPGDPLAQLVESGSPVLIADLAAHQAYLRRDPSVVAMVELADVRTYLLVPLRKDDELIGALGITREQVQPFTDRQIDLVADFAAQATTALEITRRERQYREAQMALAHANRVATLGQLTASIAHELRQPLSAVAMSGSTTLRWLAMQPPEYEKAKGAAERVIEGTRRAIDIVTGLTDLTKKQGSRKDLIDINVAIMDVNVLIHSEALKSGVSVHTDFASYLPRVKGDRVQLQQVILNLIVNAVQAMSGLDSDRRDLLISTDTVGAEGVRVGVRDNGPGLTSESLPRLFEPFYTTKADGMGMGLAICRSIIETHGGRLWATALEPHGALFQFTIPAEQETTS